MTDEKPKRPLDVPTAAPWFQGVPQSNFQKNKVEIRGGPDRELICTVASRKFSSEQRANARIIYSAPKLLSILDKILGELSVQGKLSHDDWRVDEARKIYDEAIGKPVAKAEGR